MMNIGYSTSPRNVFDALVHEQLLPKPIFVYFIYLQKPVIIIVLCHFHLPIFSSWLFSPILPVGGRDVL